jgi:hypothetical protein
MTDDEDSVLSGTGEPVGQESRANSRGHRIPKARQYNAGGDKTATITTLLDPSLTVEFTAENGRPYNEWWRKLLPWANLDQFIDQEQLPMVPNGLLMAHVGSECFKLAVVLLD